MKNRQDIIPKIATIHALSHDGRGIASVEGKTVFIDGALLGETLSFVVRKRHRRFDEGSALEIQTSSPDRVVPRCAHFSECGGCSLQHMSETAQIQSKQTTILEQLKHFGGVTPVNVLAPLKGPIYEYRRKARLGVRYVIKKEKILVGFREKHSNYLTDCERCEILHPTIGGLLSDLKNLISQMSIYRSIPQIEVAVGDNASALVFRHLEDFSEDDLQALLTFGKIHHLHIYGQSGGPDSVKRMWPIDEKESLSYRLPAYNIEIKFHPLDFIQVNHSINQQMVSRALELLDIKSSDRVLDLFCGLGNFTLAMAKQAKEVIGVEGSELMCKRAYENARLNDINNVEFFETNLQALPETNPWAQGKFDKVLLDPPRAGALEILGLIAELKPSKIVYVSCNPATLARDVGELVNKHGFQLVSVGLMDMFPQTTHVESIALLEKKT